MGRKRDKKISEEEFKEVQNRKWVKVVILKKQFPELLKNIPDDIYEFALASGSFDPYVDYGNEGARIVGGIDVYRSAPDDLLKYNKDHYIVLETDYNDGMLLVKGPNKPVDHWLNKMPTTSGLEVIGYVPTKST